MKIKTEIILEDHLGTVGTFLHEFEVLPRIGEKIINPSFGGILPETVVVNDIHHDIFNDCVRIFVRAWEV